MRVALAAAVLAALPAVAAAQPGAYLAVVSDPEVKLLAGPGSGFPETGTLRKGAEVVVDHEAAGGWLAVRAVDGQVSWVMATQIEDLNPDRPTPKLAHVHAEEVTLAAGRVGDPQPLDIRRVKLPQGTLLTLTGPPVTHNGKTWFPVQPPAGDFRYLPKAAVHFTKPAPATSFVVRESAPLPPTGPQAVPGDGTPSGSTPVAEPPKPLTDNPLLAQAEAAERAGRLDEAVQLYFQLAREVHHAGGNREVADLCYSRVHSIRSKQRGVVTASGTGAPQPPQPTEVASRPSLLPPTREPGAGGSGSGSAVPAIPTGNRPPVAGSRTETPPDGQWTGVGMLVRSGVTPDGRPRAYALETSPGVVRAYIVPGPGVDLDRLVNRRVSVAGASSKHRDLSYPLVVASNAEPAQ